MNGLRAAVVGTSFGCRVHVPALRAAGLVGHEFRFSPARALVARLLSDGAVGTPQLATLVQHIDLVADPAARVPEWWFDAERGGGWLGASGSHVIDQVHHWLGAVDAVR